MEAESCKGEGVKCEWERESERERDARLLDALSLSLPQQSKTHAPHGPDWKERRGGDLHGTNERGDDVVHRETTVAAVAELGA